jgi:outer membrane lipoprotein-sorting protein
MRILLYTTNNTLSSFDGIKRLLLEKTKIELLGTSNIGNKKVYLIKEIPPERLDPEITHEVYSVDSKTFIVLSVEMFVDKDLVFQYKVEDIKVNIDLPDNYFTL